VAQQLLDREQVHPAFEQVRGEAVAQRVRPAPLVDARAVAGAVVGALHHALAHGLRALRVGE
jgi:hypothetical protein